jgi:hypothetical protein
MLKTRHKSKMFLGVNRITQATSVCFLTIFMIDFEEIFKEYSWNIFEKFFKKFS